MENSLEHQLNNVMQKSKNQEIDILKNEIFKDKTDQQRMDSEQAEAILEKGLKSVNLKKLSQSTKKKSFTYPLFVLIVCFINMLWSVLNGIIKIDEYSVPRGTVYCKVFLLSTYLAIWTMLIICYNTLNDGAP